MALWFDIEEFLNRQSNLKSVMETNNLDGMLLFKQESMYYLTGYDTDGFVLFQTLFVGINGEVTLVTRSADHYQAEHTSTIKDIRIWKDSGNQNPASDVADMLRGHAMQGKKIGVETEYWSNGNPRVVVPYANGTLNGTSKLYGRDGSLEKTTTWKNGMPGKSTFHERK